MKEFSIKSISRHDYPKIVFKNKNGERMILGYLEAEVITSLREMADTRSACIMLGLTVDKLEDHLKELKLSHRNRAMQVLSTNKCPRCENYHLTSKRYKPKKQH